MRILVPGGSGYVGGITVDLLEESGHDVRVYDNLLFEDIYLKQVDFYRGDIRDIELLKPHLKWADCVVWLAALVGDPLCAMNPKTTMEVNAEALRIALKNFDGRLIFPSTCSVYGAQDDLLDESSPVAPLSVYGTSKLRAEEIIDGRPNSLIFRLGTLFGKGDNWSRIRADLVVNTLSIRAHTTGEISLFGGDQWRPLLHVRDVAFEIIRQVDNDSEGVYNLKTTNLQIKDFADIFCTVWPDLRVKMVSRPHEDLRNYRVSSRKAEKELGFNPKLNIEAGIWELNILLRAGRLPNPEAQRFSNVAYTMADESKVR